MRHLALALLVCPAILGAAPTAVQVVDLGSLGGSPFPVYVGAFGRNGTLAGSTRRPGIGDVPFAWTAAGGFRVISEAPGVVHAANGKGQVVGLLQHEDRPWEAYVWTPPGTLRLLSHPGANEVIPQAINDKGQVAGVLDLMGGERHAFLWSEAAGFTDLGFLGGYDLAVTDITEKGLVVGHAENADGNMRAFRSANGNRIRSLGTLGGDWSYATAANDSGKIVGYSRNPDGNVRAFAWQAGTMSELPTTTLESAAYAVNNAGSVAGSAMHYGERQAVLWGADGSLTPLGDADIAVDINAAGQAAAYKEISGGRSVAYLWSNGTLVDASTEHDRSTRPLGVTADGSLVCLREDPSGVNKSFLRKPDGERSYLDGLEGGWSRAMFVNAAGQVAGISRTVLGYNRAFVWTQGTMIEIPAPVGHSTPVALNAHGAVAGTTHTFVDFWQTAGPSFFWSGSGAAVEIPHPIVDLNDAGQVVGYRPDAAFVWSAGSTTDLPPMGDGGMIPSALNNFGQVVGRFNIDAWTIHAFSWKAGTPPVDLGTLGGTYSEAVAVNDAGQIAGNSTLASGETRAFRMSASSPMTDLEVLFGEGQSYAVAMSRNGYVAGSSHDGTSIGAFVYDSKMKFLGKLLGYDEGPRDVNAAKEVVGWTFSGEYGEPRAFIASPGSPLTELDRQDGDGSMAWSINGLGEVAGEIRLWDGHQRAVLWRTR